MSEARQIPQGASEPGEVLLEMRGLRIEARTGEQWHEIVHGIDLKLRRGEVLGLIGESGAGKSTIGLAALGYARDGCRISGGEILFDGVDLARAPEETRRRLRGSRIAYVAQSAAAAFNPAHRLIDQYAEAPIYHGLSSRDQATGAARDLYARLHLPEPETIGFRYPHQVSGGQLQRAMVAMAMASRPDLIVFDEPTTALDVTTQIEVMAAIKDIVEQFDTAAIYVTHDLAVVAQMADRIMVLRDGELIEEGTTPVLLQQPAREYTRDLLSVRQLHKDARPIQRDAPPLLRVDNITAAYGRQPVLHDVSLDIHHQRTVAVVGESGSGKSTLARVITGLLPPRKGRILYGGTELPASYRDRSRDQLRRIQMINQMPDTALNPRQRVRDVIGRPLSFYLGLSGRRREERIRELLSLIELEPDLYLDRLTTELSGGQKQRICIARALAAEPETIVCDEVTSALDQLVGEEILQLLIRLQDELEVSYMLITHDLATVRAIADAVVVMKSGAVVEAGTKDEVFSPPHHAYTELLLSSVPEMDPEWLDGVLATRGADFRDRGIRRTLAARLHRPRELERHCAGRDCGGGDHPPDPEGLAEQARTDQRGDQHRGLPQSRDMGHRPDAHGPDRDAIRHRGDCAAAEPARPVRAQRLPQPPLAQPEADRGEQCPLEHEQPGDIGQRRAGQAHTRAVHHDVGGDRAPGQQCEQCPGAIGAGTTATPRQAQDPEADNRDAEGLGPAQHLAREQPRAGGHQGGRTAARDRVDLAQVAVAIGGEQGGGVEQMNDHRRDQPGPARRARQRYQRDHRQPSYPGAHHHKHQRGRTIAADLDQGVPGGMQRTGEHDRGDYADIQHQRHLPRRPAGDGMHGVTTV